MTGLLKKQACHRKSLQRQKEKSSSHSFHFESPFPKGLFHCYPVTCNIFKNTFGEKYFSEQNVIIIRSRAVCGVNNSLSSNTIWLPLGKCQHVSTLQLGHGSFYSYCRWLQLTPQRKQVSSTSVGSLE